VMLDKIRREHFPEADQRWGVFLGWLLVLAVVAGFVSAKAWAYSFLIFAGVVILSHVIRGRDYRTPLDTSPVTYLLLAFLAYAFFRTDWTSGPLAGPLRFVAVLTFGMASLAATTAISGEAKANIVRMAEGLWIALLLAMCFFAVELALTGGKGGIRSMPIVLKFVKVRYGEVTRVMTPITMLLGPAVLSILGGVKRPWQTFFAVALVATATVAVFESPHDTSKIALVGWFLVLGLAYVSALWAYRALVVSWVILCLFVLPLAFISYRMDLHHAAWMPLTAGERILIWKDFAERATETAVFGHGLGWSESIRPIVSGLNELSYEVSHTKLPLKLKALPVAHPHNCYLQIWCDLGAVGIVLFMSIGLAILQRIRNLPDASRRLSFSTFAAAMLVLFSSYSLWQYWMLGLLSFVPVVSALAIQMWPKEASA
jgi:hypothetical protein